MLKNKHAPIGINSITYLTALIGENTYWMPTYSRLGICDHYAPALVYLNWDTIRYTSNGEIYDARHLNELTNINSVENTHDKTHAQNNMNNIPI